MPAPILLDVDSVSVARPDRPLFTDLSLTVSAGDRIGVVGINGSGKSTLLGVMAGDVTPDSGRVRSGRDVTVATLAQRPELGDRTPRQVVGPGWEAAALADRLGVTPLLDRPPATLSGGEARRVALAAALAGAADVLVLDEPTNHLDLDAVEWLEAELARWRGAVVVVSHDRTFLDVVTTRIVALGRDGWFAVDGGYRAYLDALAERSDQAEQREASRRILARRELAWLRRGARERRRKPKSRLAVARAIVEATGPDQGVRGGSIGLAEAGASRLGRQVIELHDVGVSRPASAVLFRHVDLLLDPRARLGVVGPNGAGKSTLLDVMARRITPAEGTVVHGATVRVGYFDQHGAHLPADLTVLEVVAGPHQPPGPEHTALLRRFWFEDDTHRAPVAMLSGGERRRLELVAVLATRPNVLLLDEPTNDLDLDTLRSLEDFLDDWPGAVVAVTHDRTFLERVAEHVLVLGGGDLVPALGGAAVWQHVAASASPRRSGAALRGAPPPSSPRRARAATAPDAVRRRSPSTLARLLGQSEDRIAELTVRRAELEERLGGEVDHVRLAATAAQLGVTLAELEAEEERWLELASEAEGVST